MNREIIAMGNRFFPKYSLVVLVALGFLLMGCANPITPEGGPRDTQPPQIDTLRSTPNFQTNFTRQTIELTFDEWVTLNDVFNQVVISPPLAYDPDITLKKKTVRIAFDEQEELRKEATYTIQFGESIKDLTEGNAADLRFVFSTGPILDSLSVSGSIVDAQEGNPVEDVLFMLYENQSDTVVRTERPFYFAKTDKEGKFQLNNVKAGTFKAFALKDQNLNYRFDQRTEAIGFPDTFIEVTNSTPEINIRLFQETPPLQLVKTDQSAYGTVKLAFNRNAFDLKVTELADPPARWYVVADLDTLRIFYESESNNTSFSLQLDTSFLDTLVLEVPEKATFLNETFLREITANSGGPMAPTATATWIFDRPIQRIDSRFIQVIPDSASVTTSISWVLDTLDPRQIYAIGNWTPGMGYQVVMSPGAVTDWYGRTTSDTLSRKLNIGRRDDFGNMAITISGLDSSRQYVAQLFLRTQLVETFEAIESTTFEVSQPFLPPGGYTLVVIEDENGNGRWDPGNYELKIQPEKRQIRELEQLRANWDLEVLFEWRKDKR